MKTALILACFVVMMTVYTVRAQGGHVACTEDSDCTADCPTHHGFSLANVGQHGNCHCHSVHACTADSDCSCSTEFTASCEHGHCHCHHHH
ncbi:uncharacterized protein LOC110463116 isoform X2 [Mizuhopecten yessoensis]|uniref:uncharacterized protein LOC110463116 isoform X2 n=1 Tax=Mizuhopecten yessoensis TaxID=6573 RepID=UPI000B4586F9|nr:uncharacterized protein LOC110463116 isoform X2 [Mizuhopecten yessoensis]